MYAWIGINFVLGRFEHIEEGKCLFVLSSALVGSYNHNSCPRAEELSAVRWLSVGAGQAELLSKPQLSSSEGWTAWSSKQSVPPEAPAEWTLLSPDDEAVVEVNVPGSESSEAIVRKRTAGILDMGGVSTQIAYEVPKTVSFASSQQVIICTDCFMIASIFI